MIDWTAQTWKWVEAQQSLWSEWTQLAMSANPWLKGSAGTPAAAETENPLEAGRKALFEWLSWMTSALQEAAALAPAGFPQMVGNMSATWPSAMGTPFGMDAFRRMIDPLLDAPTLGLTRELEGKNRQLTKAILAYTEAYGAYGALVAEAWGNATVELQQALIRGETPVTGLADLADAWSHVVDPALIQFFKSEPYVRAQGRLLTAAMNLRRTQRAVNEAVAEALDMPTRSEVDAAHRINYEQRNQIKALQRELRALQDEVARLQEPIARQETQ